MSGVLGRVLDVVSALNQVTLNLGGVLFQAFELPERMPFGGPQHLSIHETPGGGRQIDALGSWDRNQEWSGIFSGPAALARARQIETMKRAGNPVPLVWASFSGIVVIQNFEADFTKGGFWIPYRISCVPLPALAAPSGGTPTVTAQIGADIASAASYAQDAVNAVTPLAATLGLAGPLTVAQGYLSTATGLAAGVGSLDSVAGLPANMLGNLTSAGQGFFGSVSAVGSDLGALTSAAPSGSIVSDAPSLTSALGMAETQASAATAFGYAARAAINTVPLMPTPLSVPALAQTLRVPPLPVASQGFP